MITYVFNNPPPLSIATIGQSWPWLIFVGVELGIFGIGLLAFSRMIARSPNGSSRDAPCWWRTRPRPICSSRRPHPIPRIAFSRYGASGTAFSSFGKQDSVKRET